MSGLPRDPTESLALIRRAQGGDLDCFDRLFARYYERVRRITRARLGPKLRRDLETDDIVQETFVAAVRGFDRFEVRDNGTLIHWLSRIAERRILAELERQGRRKRTPDHNVVVHFQEARESGEVDLEPPASAAGPLTEAIQVDDLDLVEQCLQELREDLREVILLRVYAGASWEVIQELQGAASPSAVRMKYGRAIAQLTRVVQRQSRRGAGEEPAA